MASRFVPVTGVEETWKYRQAGLLYWRFRPHRDWQVARCDLPKHICDEAVKGGTNQYAILVESEDESAPN